MPELPEVETVRRGLQPVLEGRKLVNVEIFRPDLRWPIPDRFCEKLVDKQIVRLDRRAKYILWHFENNVVLILHLGMSGRISVEDERPKVFQLHDHIVFTTDRGHVICFNDARRFGSVDITTVDGLQDHKLLKRLGPEPLGNSFNGPTLFGLLTGRKTSIKSALLDQTVISGLGNIYVCEALYQAKISPLRLANTVRKPRVEKLAKAIRYVLSQAIDAGGSTLRDYINPSGELGYFQHQFQVYNRVGQQCFRPKCDGTISRIVQSARSTFYCARCQR